MHAQLDPDQVPTGITMVSRHVEAGAFRLPRAHHHRIMVHASAATHSYCSDVGRHFLRRAGDIDFVPADQEGGFEAETAFRTIEVRLPSALLEDVARQVGGTTMRRLDTRHLVRDERIEHLVRALKSGHDTGAPTEPLFIESLGVALAVRLLGLGDRETDRPVRLSNTQLRHVLEHIDAHLHEPLTIDRLSRVANASSSHLRTWFKAATGMTVHRYVLRRRVERARSLLLGGGLSTSEVAHQAGFAHQSHMAYWMRREIGQTPRGLRRGRMAS
ncbi:MAG: helix-turn-helix domain-containing protein [Mesorhizobium sp.]|uniref:AraC family transcriptional regulator n=2 Tax=Mesorhizobium TaxID=68287 RepID=UPI000F7604C5|nr:MULTISPECIES: AraC family transcriptional regulator [unclassified Mesorhizobium]RVD71051.1 helix-turn-helix domain-containing protein [Mesorhizobium sp. M4A.F.Ca.ET.029.04.2.1]AZO47140.1 AraC family transcriptional regulator [Mesorhizobium sp. M4B.F.Ca.ET.058.02.1.1]RUX47219.1 helix-turn-helix domain-containing protein [Mesorhizobium sp. M4A.F.Ca.ET.050.02.1.1]RVC40709.1 helix-turn-helix domain-containing protein [Mesorhizobium sp. M4A.F.Ca.ET.090.04.2.1]RVD41798.1 helix-turn-helix domain-c